MEMRSMFQQMKDMVPYEGKMKFKVPTSNVKVTVEYSKPSTEGVFARLKGKLKKRNTNAQMQDGCLDGGSCSNAGSYQNISKRVSAHRESYRRATGVAFGTACDRHDQDGRSVVLCQPSDSLECVRSQEQGALPAQLPTQPAVLGRGNLDKRPAIPPPIPPPSGRSLAHHEVVTDYGNEDEDIYESTMLREKLVTPPPIPPRCRSQPALHQVDENGFELYDNMNLSTAPDNSPSNHQETSDAEKIMQAHDDDSSDEDKELMEPYEKILQAKRAPVDNIMDADGYMAVMPRQTDDYINCELAQTLNNQPFPEHGQMWLTWCAEGKVVRIPVNMAKSGQAAES